MTDDVALWAFTGPDGRPLSMDSATNLHLAGVQLASQLAITDNAAVRAELIRGVAVNDNQAADIWQAALMHMSLIANRMLSIIDEADTGLRHELEGTAAGIVPPEPSVEAPQPNRAARRSAKRRR
ncbi:hypothetical protein SAMN04515671_0088 [Nakamurella panacisegetis]|uniref:Uncharacterized protein n=1 Tax=Nakamurella panacisegetis TaxID=1090615 RepID=A0A1H0HIW6_9ACTN|nr:hypothetical protein [Nakamurella panacisegetis]SDO19040.1 hypothetical protein SAMN04515671_0088 [Nakamurella panacisegetis]